MTGEVIGLSPARNGDIFITGFTDPPQDSKRVTSYVERRSAQGHRVWRLLDEKVSWHQSMPWDDGGVIVIGTIFSEEEASGAVIARLSANGHVLWRRVFDGKAFEQTVALARSPTGEIQFAVHEYFSDNDQLNRVRVRQLDANGQVRADSYVDLEKRSTDTVASVLFDGETLWVTTNMLVSMGDKLDKDELTGYSEPCGYLAYLSKIYKVDRSTFRVLKSKTLYGFQAWRLTIDRGRTFVAGAWQKYCRFETTPAVMELDHELGTSSVFLHYGVGLGGYARDVQFTRDGTAIVAGALQTYFDVEAYRPVDPQKPYMVQLGGDLIKEPHHTMSAFLVAVSPDGRKIVDHVYPDLRGRMFNTFLLTEGEVLAAGVAGGASGWILKASRSTPWDSLKR